MLKEDALVVESFAPFVELYGGNSGVLVGDDEEPLKPFE